MKIFILGLFLYILVSNILVGQTSVDNSNRTLRIIQEAYNSIMGILKQIVRVIRE